MDSPVVHVILEMHFLYGKTKEKGLNYFRSRVWRNIIWKETNHQ
jgi:hypothetical protein